MFANTKRSRTSEDPQFQFSIPAEPVRPVVLRRGSGGGFVPPSARKPEPESAGFAGCAQTCYAVHNHHDACRTNLH